MTDLKNKNTEKEIKETDDMLISFVLNECGMNDSVMLIAKDVNGVDVEVVAVEFIAGMLHNLPDYVLDKLETVSSDAELRDALRMTINQVKSLTVRHPSFLGKSSLEFAILIVTNERQRTAESTATKAF